TMFVIFGEHAGRAIAMVDDFETGGLQALDQTSGAQSGGSFFAARQECGCAGGRANQGNLLLLTGYFDRQERLLKFALTGPGPRPMIPFCRLQLQKSACPNLTPFGPSQKMAPTKPLLVAHTAGPLQTRSASLRARSGP